MTKTKKPTKSDLIQGHLRQNPSHSVGSVANKFKASESLVYTLRKKLKIEQAQNAPEATLTLSPELEEEFSKLAHAPVEDTPVSVDKTLNERANTYGRFVDVAETTQVLMGAIANRLAERGTIVQHDQALALQMIAQKLARIANGDPDHLDSWLDIAGYATLVAERLSGKAPR
ncbi:hypothetical protein UFOVP1058_13 [uncultured Caudovirales phage]|uniref:DUF6378 domain-containing protein n=1 Tax=uncultured Caudovirales phage TaxID=2100421 RepID=A0A6J5P9A0_9CAUD|nr:hypothetical protein UFOVP656_67 [uncultured Caudovirales phage]CAB4167443.1 hypothetical protein UFOVP857_20 [uncultured Caudovirales phage]CAB4168429.1 hypothetical protein UFOVP879_26 [uncultured Caudovirales phage]CAB4181078.1 hypothetical protein UFOVP1058_13 [uncultured Caudovirales phage]CAB4195687.1 hypothetical protein UFOVP1289_37 [uncultured Caudovirales phage]